MLNSKMESQESMTADELIVAIRIRIADPDQRIAMRTVPPPPLFGVVAASALEKTEADLGFRIPVLLRRLYSEVGNGGFGPGAGMLGVEGGYCDSEGRTLAPCYLEFKSWGWPDGLLPLWDWGGGALSCVDSLSADERIVTHDESGPVVTRFTLLSWLESWVDGVDLWREIYEMESGVLTNPFTHAPVVVARRGRAKGLV
ncbi:MAG: SMI1/KNR4 family protein [Byssovorax sp.]